MGGSQGYRGDPFGFNFYGQQGGIGSLGGPSRSLGSSGFAAPVPDLYSWERFENQSPYEGTSNEMWQEAEGIAKDNLWTAKQSRGWNPPTGSAVASGRRRYPTVSESMIQGVYENLLSQGSPYVRTPYAYVAPDFQYVAPPGTSYGHETRSLSDLHLARGVRGYKSGGVVDAFQDPYAESRGPEIEEAPSGFGAPVLMDPEMSSSQDIIQNAILAISQPESHPNPEKARADFVEKFGEAAYFKLEQRVLGNPSGVETGTPAAGFNAGGQVPVGDGMSDSVPANIDGVEQVALSQGEFVVPADVVSGLGNGSTDAGAQRLYELMANVRHSRTGTTQQPPAINASELVA